VIVVEGVRKAFGPTVALQGVDLVVEPGIVQALLGPNGAGKTTLVRILSTLQAPDAGRAWICGTDVVREPQRVRSLIGLAGQSAAVDGTLTGRENLEFVGQLYGLRRREARARAGEVLERLSLSAAADRRVFTYSGGMQRRLDLGASLVGRPLVLIMDEPTSGLDPVTRRELWRLVGEFAEQGTTVLLTTQYLEEADALAKQIAVIERGRIIAAGTSRELKERFGQDVLEVRARNRVDVERVRRMLVGLGSADPVADMRWQKVTLPTNDPVATLLSAGSRLEESGIAVEDLGWRPPTLDDVFLTLTASESERPVNGAAAIAPPSGADGPPALGGAPPRRRRRRRRRRLLSYVTVAGLTAALAALIISGAHKSSPEPRHAPASPQTVKAMPKPRQAPANPRTVASIAGIIQGRTIALGSTPGGLTADTSGNLWVSLPDRGAIARVDATTGRTQTFRVGGHPAAIAAAFDRIWVAGSALGPLASLNSITGRPLSSTQLLSAPTAIGLGTSDQSACTIDSSGTVTHINSTGVAIGTARLSHPATGVGCGEGWVWTVQPTPPALVRMGAYGGTTEFNGGPAPSAVALDLGVWIANRNGEVTVFDPRLNDLRVNREITVAPELDGIYAAENDQSVWATSRQTKALYRISNTPQPSLTATVVFNSAPVAVALRGQSVWVATADGHLTQLED
jgi:daunorubicin resistance ABC transporter ATP-binding subunit